MRALTGLGGGRHCCPAQVSQLLQRPLSATGTACRGPEQRLCSPGTAPSLQTTQQHPGPKVPAEAHLGAFVSGAAAGPAGAGAGAGPEGASSGPWAGARSSTSSASMGSRGAAWLSTASEVCELKAPGSGAMAGA